jgi:hypothetical protein
VAGRATEKSPTFDIDMFLMIEIKIENDGHPLYIRPILKSPCFFTSYANRAIHQLQRGTWARSRGSGHQKVFR